MDYNKNFTIKYISTKEHMSIFEVKFIVVQIKGQSSKDLSIKYFLDN
jgi:hypothetical protein